MIMASKETIIDYIERASMFLKKENLNKSLSILFMLADIDEYAVYRDSIEDIQRNYKMMTDYLQKGFKDEHRQEIIDKLKTDTNAIIQSCSQKLAFSFNSSFHIAKSNSDKIDLEIEQIKAELEKYVTDCAMLTLENDKTVRNQNLQYISEDHADYCNRLFGKLWTSKTFSEATANEMTELLLSSTIEIADVLLMISAITIGGMEFYDPNKLKVLIEIYRRSVNENVRQRAFVGWVFVYQSHIFMTQKMNSLISQLLSDEQVVGEISEMQRQIAFCLNAERDRNTIQNEIMPDIMKHKDTLSFNRFGVEEKDDDDLQHILDPDASENAMDDVQANIQRIMGMDKEGSDIYYGGFKYMKSFSFFNKMSNWFCMFTFDNPELKDIADGSEQRKMLQVLISAAPFCDSDKYSFCIATAKYLNQLPMQLKSMASLTPDVFDLDDEVKGRTTKPSYIRRNYLQSIYRFYHQSNMRGDFRNPFEFPSFYENMDLWQHLHRDIYDEIVKFYIQMDNQKTIGMAEKILETYPIELHDYDFYVTRAKLTHSVVDYLNAYELNNDSESALKGLASYMEGVSEYKLAETYYRKLLKLKPSLKYEVKLCCCLLEQDKFDEAVKMLYKIDFEHPENITAKRALAWGLFGSGKLDESENVYRKILASAKPQVPDYLNAAYVALAMGNYALANKRYKLFCKGNNNLPQNGRPIYVEQALHDDMKYLKRYGIAETDIWICFDADFEA